jgi:anti-anti-sigma regulatory factor
MTLIKVDSSGGIARLIVSGPLVRGEGAMGAIQRIIHRCSITKFCTLVVNLRGVEVIDQDGVDALTVAYHAARSLGAEFHLEDVPCHIASQLAKSAVEALLM